MMVEKENEVLEEAEFGTLWQVSIDSGQQKR
jgi:hypothetical protein